MSAKVTLKDVAREAGVRYQTVSKVLQGQIKVTPETQARIETAVSHLGYRPNVAARNLRTQSSNLIGYAWRLAKGAATLPILDQFLASAAEVVEAHGYHLLTFLIGDDEPLNVTPYRELFARRQVEGFILADTNHNDPRIAYLIEQNIPFASFGRANDTWDYCWVDVDGQCGTRITAFHPSNSWAGGRRSFFRQIFKFKIFTPSGNLWRRRLEYVVKRASSYKIKPRGTFF